MDKASTKEIEARFDNDVATFSNLSTGQSALIDAPLLLEVTTEAARRIAPNASRLLDIGCGAGNFTLKMLEKLPNVHCTLVDLSARMLERAVERVSQVSQADVEAIHGDLRTVELPTGSFDIILAGAVLHHLRTDDDWQGTFRRLYSLLRPGGCLLVSDLVLQDVPELNKYAWERFAAHLDDLGGEAYRKEHLKAVEREDTPRPLLYQLRLMLRVGFAQVDVIHKNACFASFCGIK
ncbi:MAG: methyltransferase domain-containing protein [Prevotellaceae bacterium]|nr:methyltransferase domain-containing protein [Prevotellaceae bacterium]